MVFKFAAMENNGNHGYSYTNLFRREVYQEWSRVTIAPKEKHVSLMLEIAKGWTGPFGILYVLKVPRRDHKEGRYQSPQPCSFEELEQFARQFEDYLEGDGRHHIWFRDFDSCSQLIYDNHDLIFAYGDEERIISILKAKGFKEGEPTIPDPHAHCYNRQFDTMEDQIIEYFDWLEFPLEDHDYSS